MTVKPTKVVDYDPLDPDSPEYYRLNSSAMSAVLEAMIRSGCIDDEMPSPEVGDHWPPSGLDEDRADELEGHLVDGEELDEPPTAAELRIYNDGQAKLEVVLAVCSPRPDAVPFF